MSKYAPSSKILDWLFIFFAGCMTVGIHIDGWAHIHLGDTLETFFTPWHALFYAGIFAIGVLLAAFLLKNYRDGYDLRYALPKEYMFSFIGICFMLIAGVGDMIWHIVFGIETGMDALFSPTHILLAIGGAVGVSGPLYAIWHRPKGLKIHSVPTIFSTLYFLSVITFMLQFLHPLANPWAATSYVETNKIFLDYGIMLGIGSMLAFTVMFLGVLLSTVRHWKYPFGSMTFILGLNAVLMTFMYDAYYQFIVTGFIAGFLIDIVYMVLIYEKGRKMSHIHVFSFLAPFIYSACFMATIYATDTIFWTVHTWTGSIFITGIVGYLLSFLVMPAREA